MLRILGKEDLCMRESNHVVSEDEIKSISSIKDENAIKLAEEAKPGINPFYHTIGTMGGIAVREKYSTVESMKNSERKTSTK